ncbi:hypothetical protein, partial [Mesorhizobium sp. P5_C1]
MKKPIGATGEVRIGAAFAKDISLLGRNIRRSIRGFERMASWKSMRPHKSAAGGGRALLATGTALTEQGIAIGGSTTHVNLTPPWKGIAVRPVRPAAREATAWKPRAMGTVQLGCFFPLGRRWHASV